MNRGEDVVIFNLYGQFEEIAVLVADTLARRGCRISRTDVADPASQQLYIIFGANVWVDAVILPPRYIIFQLEQTPIKKWFTPDYFARLQNAIQVWDYNLQNIEYLRERGIDAIHVPLGYSPIFPGPQPSTPETIDILFLGQLRNDHRERTIAELRAAGLNIMASNSIFGDQKAQVVAQSKVVLNLHYGYTALLEEARIIPLLAAGKVVISETVLDSRYLHLYQDHVVFSNTTAELIELCRKWVNVSSEERRIWGDRARLWLTTQRQVSQLIPWHLIEETPPTLPYYEYLNQAPDTCREAYTNRLYHLSSSGWYTVRHYGNRSWMRRGEY